MIVSVHATVDGRYNAGMVVSDDGIHAERHGTGSPNFGSRVMDGNSDRRRQRTVVVTSRYYDGQNRAENFRVLDGADNAGRLDTDTGRYAGKSQSFIFPSPRYQPNALERQSRRHRTTRHDRFKVERYITHIMALEYNNHNQLR